MFVLATPGWTPNSVQVHFFSPSAGAPTSFCRCVTCNLGYDEDAYPEDYGYEEDEEDEEGYGEAYEEEDEDEDEDEEYDEEDEEEDEDEEDEDEDSDWDTYYVCAHCIQTCHRGHIVEPIYDDEDEVALYQKHHCQVITAWNSTPRDEYPSPSSPFFTPFFTLLHPFFTLLHLRPSSNFLVRRVRSCLQPSSG